MMTIVDFYLLINGRQATKSMTDERRECMEFLLFFMFLSFVVIAWILFLCNFADKNNWPKKVAFGMFVANIAYNRSLYLVIAGVVFLVIFDQVNNFLLGLACAFSLLLIIPKIRVASVVPECLEEVKMVKDMMFAEIEVDYFHMSENSIALNVKNSRVCLAVKDSTGKTHIKNLSIEVIKKFEFIQDYSDINESVYDEKTMLGLELDKFKSRLESMRKTGLFLYLDDIDFPVVCISMPFDSAQKWLVLLERFFAGKLEPRSTPFTLNT